jgi:hypothetical protein
MAAAEAVRPPPPAMDGVVSVIMRASFQGDRSIAHQPILACAE